MSTSSPAATMAGGVVVVTHVIPAPQNSTEKNKFSQARLVGLGTVQIIIGLMVFLFGIIRFPHGYTLDVYTGVFIWGAVCFITAGSLTVAAGTSSNHFLVNGALWFSIFAAVSSAAAATIYSLDGFGLFMDPSPFYSDSAGYHFYQVHSRGLSGVLAVFSVLEFVVSISVSVFSCKASRCSTDQQPTIIINQSHQDPSEMPQTPTTDEAPPTDEAPSPQVNEYETVRTPEYNTIINNTQTPPTAS